MSKSVVITARVDEPVAIQLDQLASQWERSRAWLVSKAIERFIADEQVFDAFVKEGEDQIDSGDYLTQEQMEAWVASRYPPADAA